MKRKDGRFAEEKKLAMPLSRLGKARTPCASQNSSPGFTEPTLPRKRRGKYRHCSTRALAGLASFADRSTPLH